MREIANRKKRGPIKHDVEVKNVDQTRGRLCEVTRLLDPVTVTYEKWLVGVATTEGFST